MGTLRRKPGREVWTAIYRDGDGIKREVSTGCKSKDAAKQVLADLERDKERVISGVTSRQEARTAKWSEVPLAEHITAHAAHMEGLGRAACTVQDQKRLMTAVADGCGWKSIADLNRPQLERWLNARVSEGMGARTRNAHAVAAVAFGNWLVKAGRLTLNPFAKLPMMNVKADVRHERRVLTLEEFARLVDAAEWRPLERKAKGTLKPETIDGLKWLGRTRAMIYKTLFYTGLRYGELRSIKLGQVRLDAGVPHFELRATDEKARRGAQVPLPAHLAAVLGEYITERKKRIAGHPGASVTPFSGSLDTIPLFEIPSECMSHVFDADLVFAGLATFDKKKRKVNKSDAQGRTLDVHALRHSFCTMVAQSGINMQTAQRLMRHATPAMTARYTHLTLTDLGGAMATLPVLPEPQREVAAVAETAPNLRPTLDPTFSRTPMQNAAISCTLDSHNMGGVSEGRTHKNPNKHKGFVMVGEEGVEPSIRHRQRILSPPCMPFHHSPTETDLLETARIETVYHVPRADQGAVAIPRHACVSDY